MKFKIILLVVFSTSILQSFAQQEYSGCRLQELLQNPEYSESKLRSPILIEAEDKNTLKERAYQTAYLNWCEENLSLTKATNLAMQEIANTELIYQLILINSSEFKKDSLWYYELGHFKINFEAINIIAELYEIKYSEPMAVFYSNELRGEEYNEFARQRLEMYYIESGRNIKNMYDFNEINLRNEQTDSILLSKGIYNFAVIKEIKTEREEGVSVEITFDLTSTSNSQIINSFTVYGYSSGNEVEPTREAIKYCFSYETEKTAKAEQQILLNQFVTGQSFTIEIPFEFDERYDDFINQINEQHAIEIISHRETDKAKILDCKSCIFVQARLFQLLYNITKSTIDCKLKVENNRFILY